MKIVSFNINGLRARPHQLAALIDKHQPDVIGLQETKVHDEQFPLAEVQALGYHVHYHGQKGHYGVALLSRQAPLTLHKGFETDDEDAQRRFIWGTFADANGVPVTIMNGYFPQRALLQRSAATIGNPLQQRPTGRGDGRRQYFPGGL
jgi:exodeoxyribonuclease-3